MMLRIQIAKLKARQYLLRANLPNLMLTKISHYTIANQDIAHLKYSPMLAQSYASHCLHLPSASQKADLCIKLNGSACE